MRNKGVIKFPSNFEPGTSSPLDARNLVGTKADLTTEATWLNQDGNLYIYKGMLVSVSSDTTVVNNGVYRLTNPAAYNLETSWVKEGNMVIIDNDNALFNGATKIKFQGASIEYDGASGSYIVSGFEGPTGVSGIDFLGDYVDTTEYYQRDCIRVANPANPQFGNSYYCKAVGPISGIEPGLTPSWETSWSLFVLKGSPGNNGYTPVKGVDYDDGADGREVQISSNTTAIIWRYVGEASWSEVVKFVDLPIVGGGSSPLLTSDIPVYGTSFGKYANGTTIPAVGKTLEQVIRDAAFKATNPSSLLTITSGAPAYNSTDITNTLSFTNNPNPSSGGPTIVSEILRVKRGPGGTWAELINNVVLEEGEELPVGSTSTEVSAISSSGTYSDVYDSIVDKVTGFYYEYEVVDSKGLHSTSSANITPLAYAEPTVVDVTDSKEIGDLGFNVVRSIIKQSVNTTLASWQLLVELNSSGTKYTVGSAISASTSTQPAIIMANAGTISINGTVVTVTTANGYNANLKDATSIKLYIRVTDSVGTTDLPTLTRSLTYKKFYGTTSAVITDYRTLPSVNASNNSHSWYAAGKNHHILVPSGKSLTAATASPTGENLISNFQAGQTSVNVNDAGGNPRAYTLYKFTTPVDFNNTINATTN